MQLCELIRHSSAQLTAAQRAIEVHQLVLDSRQASRDCAFFAVAGSQHHGADFIEAAIAQGACVIFCQAGTAVPSHLAPKCVFLKDLMAEMTLLAANFYQTAGKVQLLGITGTDGKSSISHFLAQALSAADVPTGVIGTLGNGMLGALTPSQNTTPDALTIAQTMAAVHQNGGKMLAMEVSSHALALGRVAGLGFRQAILSNLGRDHMDFHHSSRAYMQAKAQLFAQAQSHIINGDDDFGAYLIRHNRDFNGVVYGFDADLPKVANVLQARNLKLHATGLAFEIRWQKQNYVVKSPLYGAFNAYNLLAVIASLLDLGQDIQTAVECCQNLKPPRGRMHQLGSAHTPQVLVDYAHTPQALKAALTAARAHLAAHNQLTVVFGCGGERDKSKRAPMGDIAAKLADKVIVTNDNPRGEHPQNIIDKIKGAHTDFIIEPARQNAIATAIMSAKVGDLILIAGKGHERTQIIGSQVLEFDDISQAQQALAQYPQEYLHDKHETL